MTGINASGDTLNDSNLPTFLYKVKCDTMNLLKYLWNSQRCQTYIGRILGLPDLHWILLQRGSELQKGRITNFTKVSNFLSQDLSIQVFGGGREEEIWHRNAKVRDKTAGKERRNSSNGIHTISPYVLF